MMFAIRAMTVYHESAVQSSITELFTDSFISRHSRYLTLQEMVKACNSGETAAVLTQAFPVFCPYMTDFRSWNVMLEAAKAECLKRKKAELTL